jgi:hypothetical protein
MHQQKSGNVYFIGQQDGLIEIEFTSQVSVFLEDSGTRATAYLCRLHYGTPDQVSVAVCIASPDGEQMGVVNGISSIFQKMFGQHEHLDIIFVDNDQQSSISDVCEPFYQSSDC